jgi:hypothetical protein
MKKWVKTIIILMIAIIFLVPIIIVLNYISLGLLLSHFFDTIADITGINKYLINALIFLLFVPFVMGISNIFSLNSKRRKNGIIILVTIFIIYNLSLFFLTKDIYFTFSQGSNLKWYALTPEGVKYFDRPGVDPDYGIKLKPVTPDIIKNLKLLVSSNYKPVDPLTAQFFNPITGDAQLWYYKHTDGTFDFFDKPGYDPITGEALQPVTKIVYTEWENKFKLNKETNKNNTKGTEESKNARVENINSELNNSNKLGEVIEFNSTINNKIITSEKPSKIAFVIESNPINLNSASNEFSNKIEINNYQIIKDYFNNKFKSEGYFQKIYNGETTLIYKSRIFKDVNYLILGKLDFSFRKNASLDEDLISCDIDLSYKIFNKQGLIMSDVINSIGAGFSEQLSSKQAIKILSEKYSKEMTEYFNK